METTFHQIIDKIDKSADVLGSKLHISGKNIIKGICFVILLIILGSMTFLAKFVRSLIGAKDD